MIKLPIECVKVGDVILPPEREIRLWMQRELEKRNLPESALYLTVTEIREGEPDKRGRWLWIVADQTPEWNQDRKPFTFKFKARPNTPWPKIN